jgi:hypothetical protein
LFQRSCWPNLDQEETPLGAQSAKTLTNFHIERPTWFDLAHRKRDAAVFAAYGCDPGMSDEQILEKLLALNLSRANRLP